MQITGRQGEVRWGYYRAATVGSWTIAGTWPEVRLSGAVSEIDASRMSQRPLVFATPNARGSWRWPILELQIQDGALTARLGPRET